MSKTVAAVEAKGQGARVGRGSAALGACVALVHWLVRLGAWRGRVEARAGSRLARWLGGATAACLVLGCFVGSHPEGTRASLIAGKSPTESRGVRNAAALTDGIAAIAADDWKTDIAVQLEGPDASVTYDLGSVVPLRAIWFQGDHNDDYRFMSSEDGAVFEKVWDAPRVKAGGLWDRSISTLIGKGRYLRLEPSGGDGRYAVTELAVYSETPAVFPPDLARRRGVPLEVMVRTQVLLATAAAILALILAYRGAPWWWLAGCAALPLWTGIGAVEMVLRAWPVEQREVSFVRAAMAALAAAAIAREAFGPPRFLAHRAFVRTALGTAALLAVLAFYNLGRPQFYDSEHGQPTPVHLLDLRQYFGTAKYFDEIGYRGLYLADVAAYIEDTPGATLDSLRDTPMRDLDTHRMTTVGAERARIETIKQQFSPERWEAYKHDARYFREMMGDQDYLRYMFDFGGNATPVWISIAHFLFSVFDASTTAFLLTGLLDPLLFIVTFGAIWRCFGYRTMAMVMVVFGANDFIMYGTNWGGATLRHDWLMYIGLGACALKKQRWALGGFFLALSTTIRAFPALTLVTAAFPAVWWLVEYRRDEGRWPSWRVLYEQQRPIVRVLGTALLTGIVLVAVTSLRWSLPTWVDWLTKVSKLNSDAHGNSIALRGLIAGWQQGHAALIVARWPVFVAGIALFVGGVFLTCRNKSLERAAIAGLLLIPVVFYAANYYIHIVCFLPLLVLERRERTAGEAPVSVADAWVWLILLGLCVAQYWTVLVTDLGLHFHLATVLLFGAMAALLVVMIRADVREGRLPFVARFFGERVPATPPTVEPAVTES